MPTPRELKLLYAKGENISKRLKMDTEQPYKEEEIIDISYDLQTGSYIEAMKNTEIAQTKKIYAEAIADNILSLCMPDSILEAGVGEATTLSDVLNCLKNDIQSYGFDLSWSRVAYAREWLKEHGHSNTILCTGSLQAIPFANDAIDVVYTSHSIEPNRGNERAILEELYRVTRKFLILVEPGFEFASKEAQDRMDRLGYCKNLKAIAAELGYNVLHHAPFHPIVNPLNPSALTIIKKEELSIKPLNALACPKYHTPLEKLGNGYFSPEALNVYPIIDNIPCLRVENAIFASKYKEVIQDD